MLDLNQKSLIDFTEIYQYTLNEVLVLILKHVRFKNIF